MQAGDLIADRFELERLARSGGMGDVFFARDHFAGEPVAMKVLQANRSLDGARFLREAEVLADLKHPGIVRYVAHGVTPQGEPWLAMEWLEGEELSDRLARSRLSVDESVALGRCVAEALAAAHARGVVHRDIKPANLYLPSGDVERCKILDFGIARFGKAARTVTATGMMMGTPGYMAPEQARGDPDLDARTDVFALGCVLFECLTGRPAFVGEHVMALLAKILLDESPRVLDLVPGAPPALDDLVARMMAKEPDARPRDGAAVAAEIAGLGAMDGALRPPASVAPESLTRREQRLLSVVMIGGEDLYPPDAAVAPTMTSTEEAGALAPFRAAVEARGGRLEALPGGSIVATLCGSGIATDQAGQAALCALSMRAAMRDRPMALATGRGEVAGRLPVGEAIDRAARMLYARRKRHTGPAPASTPSPSSTRLRAVPIAIDEVTAGLLDARFEVGGDAAGLDLRGEREIHEAARTVLGRPTVCVGRDRELAVIDGIYAECVGEEVARAVLITGGAGLGKSRLRHEFLAAPARQGVEVWMARGDPMSAGSAFSLLGHALRSAAGIQGSEPLGIRQKKLRARVARHAPAPEVARIAQFLGEIAGAPFPDGESVQLAAARRDAQLMGDQMRRAWEDFVTLECRVQPVVLVLEDLHWGDLPTVKFVDAALRRAAEQPFLVLSLARPEVHKLFPKLWGDRALQEIRLADLTRRASERLVRHILGAAAPDDVVARLTQRAEGNAFYLEELARAFAEGKGTALPETVLAMATARLEGFEVEARRLLRAASVFGQTFWQGGVASLLGGAPQTGRVVEWLEALEAREVIDRRGEARFPGEDEYVFRHALFREAAYAMLTDGDRTLGHRLAGRWLERTGETDAMVLAEHLERGGLPAKAAGWYRRAAEDALEGNDFDGALARAERGLACLAAAVTADPESRQTLEIRVFEEPSVVSRRSIPPGSLSFADGAEAGVLNLIMAEAHRWRGRFADAEHASGEAMQLLVAGSARWYRAASEAALAASRQGRFEGLVTVTELLLAQTPEADVADARRVALSRATSELLGAARYDLADAMLDAIEAVNVAYPAVDPAAAARTQDARARRALSLGDLGEFLRLAAEALAGYERAGDLRLACNERVSVGYAQLQLGDWVDAEATLREALAAAARMGLTGVIPSAQENLGMALAGQGKWEEARSFAADALETFRAQGHRRMEAGARVYLALILAMAGDLAHAEEEARAALEVAPAPPLRAHALAALAEVLLAGGRTPEAFGAASEAIALLDSLGSLEEGEALVRLVYAEALLAAGDARFGSAVLDARDALLTRAAKIGDRALRASFLERVPENARTLELARRWAEQSARPS